MLLFALPLLGGGVGPAVPLYQLLAALLVVVGLGCLAVPGLRGVGALYVLGAVGALLLRLWVFGPSY